MKRLHTLIATIILTIALPALAWPGDPPGEIFSLTFGQNNFSRLAGYPNGRYWVGWAPVKFDPVRTDNNMVIMGGGINGRWDLLGPNYAAFYLTHGTTPDNDTFFISRLGPITDIQIYPPGTVPNSAFPVTVMASLSGDELLAAVNAPEPSAVLLTACGLLLLKRSRRRPVEIA